MEKREKKKQFEESKRHFYSFIYTHDYNPNVPIIMPNKELLLAEKTLLELVPESLSLKCDTISKLKCNQKTKKFFKSRFKLHKVLVGDSKKIYKKLNNKYFESFAEVLEAYEATCALVSPFKIPVIYKNENYAHIVEESYPIPPNIELVQEELKESKVIFNSIILKDRITKLSPGDYIHEITHSQLNSVKGAIKNYYDSELLSIFLENLYYLEECEENTFIINTLDRISSILKEILYVKAYNKNEISKDQKYDFFETCKYLVSTIKAYHLLEIYRSNDLVGKKYIISKIQEIFDGKYTLDEFLKEFNITYYNSLEPETLKKSFKF